MLSLVHRCSTRSYLSLTLTGRCFSTTHHRLEASSAPSDTKIEDAKHPKDRSAAKRLRYANDPEYRTKINAANLARHHYLSANDPEYRAEKNTKAKAWLQTRIATDPEFYAVYKARKSATNNARYKSDVQLREYKAALSARIWAAKDPAAKDEYRRRVGLYQNQRYATDFTFKQRLGLQVWLRRYNSVQELTWRTHDAELHADSVSHLCSGKRCGYEKKSKLWMKRKDSDPALYDCYKCFASEWIPEKVLPIGYEHVVFGSGQGIEPRPVVNETSGDARNSSGVGTTASGNTP